MAGSESDRYPRDGSFLEKCWEEVLKEFLEAEVGSVLCLPMEMVKPSQSDDGVRNYSPEPVDVYYNNGSLVIDTGNHRFYTRKSEGEREIGSRKTENPYENW